VRATETEGKDLVVVPDENHLVVMVDFRAVNGWHFVRQNLAAAD
jgi:hypothetical protein